MTAFNARPTIETSIEPVPQLGPTPDDEATKTLIAIRYIASGMESRVFEVKEEAAEAILAIVNSDNSQDSQVAKVQNKFFHRFWRGNRAEIYPACLEAIKKAQIPHLQTEIHDRVTLIFDDGTEKEFSTVLVSPYIHEIDKRAINYEQLLDPETGEQVQLEIISIIEKAQTVAKSDKLGLDAFGMHSLISIFSSIPKGTFLKLIELLPEDISSKLKERMKGKDILISNLITDPTSIEDEDDETVKLIDIGLLDMRKTNLLKPLAEVFYNLTMAGLIETMRSANKDLAAQEGQEPNAEIEERLVAINQNSIKNAKGLKLAPKAYQAFAKTVIKLLSPLLIKYINDAPKREEQAFAKQERQNKKAEQWSERKKSLEATVKAIQTKIEELLDETGIRFKQDILPLIKEQCQLEAQLVVPAA